MAYVAGRLERCDNGQGLGNATLADNSGHFSSTDLNGYWYTYVAYPGYRLTASFPGMLTKQTPFTQSDVNSGWLTICLDVDPNYQEPRSGGW